MRSRFLFFSMPVTFYAKKKKMYSLFTGSELRGGDLLGIQDNWSLDHSGNNFLSRRHFKLDEYMHCTRNRALAPPENEEARGPNF
jgi:hypothetical protein